MNYDLLTVLLNYLPELEDVVSCIQVVFFDILSSLIWFFRTIAFQVDNRELATLIILLILFLFAINKGAFRSIMSGVREVVVAALTPKLIIPSFLLVAYSVGIFFVASHFELWSSDILLDTILEVAIVGFPSMYITVNATSAKSIFKQFVIPEIKLGALLGLYIGIESFSLLTEFVLQFVIFILTMLQVFEKHRADREGVSRLSSCLLSLIGLGVFIASTFVLIKEWGSINWIVELENIAMAIYYPFLLLPFVIGLGYYSAYEVLNNNIKLSSKKIKPISRIYLYVCLFPLLVNIKHFRCYEATNYAGCLGLKEQRDFIQNYKKNIKKTAIRENAKIERMKFGSGQVGFDEKGIWLDWENLEKIKTNLWTIANAQNLCWHEDHRYSTDKLEVFVNVFTPEGCTSGYYVSDDRKSFICWMSNGTGFTFGMAASNGSFPPLRYEGIRPPSLDPSAISVEFAGDDDEERLINWFMNFNIDDSYQ